jgi:hypothetical protein
MTCIEWSSSSRTGEIVSPHYLTRTPDSDCRNSANRFCANNLRAEARTSDMPLDSAASLPNLMGYQHLSLDGLLEDSGRVGT